MLVCVQAIIVSNYPVRYEGDTSFGKAIVDQANVDQGEPDPDPCDKTKNETNNAPSTSAGGAGGSGAHVYAGASGIGATQCGLLG